MPMLRPPQTGRRTRPRREAGPPNCAHLIKLARSRRCQRRKIEPPDKMRRRRQSSGAATKRRWLACRCDGGNHSASVGARSTPLVSLSAPTKIFSDSSAARLSVARLNPFAAAAADPFDGLLINAVAARAIRRARTYPIVGGVEAGRPPAGFVVRPVCGPLGGRCCARVPGRRLSCCWRAAAPAPRKFAAAAAACVGVRVRRRLTC